MIRENITSMIGNTPLVRLSRVMEDVDIRLYAKLEGFNPGGSIKDRPALRLIEEGFRSGEINAETTIVESSSGNLGIGLAQVCAFYGLRFICVVDTKTTRSNLDILRAFGAEVSVVTEDDAAGGELLQARIDRVQNIREQIPNSYWPNQYANPGNALAHHNTMREILEELGTSVDYLFCATSSCGTLKGCAEYALDHSPHTKIVAVDAAGSAIFGSQPCKRLIPGHGSAIVPKLLCPDLVHQCVHVTDWECVVACRRLVRYESLLVGGSSGAILTAVGRLAPQLPPGATCVMILPDRGERYLDTIYSDEWVLRHWESVPVFPAVQQVGVEA
ncbi:MAG TPA: 2,3-diaminopropionate biosynthesis protein SbnA [Pyrinomonadaceae bacterium]|nr:2,3-diaminopropionate biosynthesis protein SbnA [Pyrinomonadaceae bacterium]